MALRLKGYEQQARQAVRAFWKSRDIARQKQQQGGISDQGERSSVTAGKNMDGFAALVTRLVEANGLKGATIMRGRRLLTLPGYFRPTKQWDLLVLNEGHLVAVIEFKSQVGPSFGNNANNRVEEAIGNAVDLWKAFREGAFGEGASLPFVGFLMLLEDSPGSRAPVKEASPHYPVFSEFQSASYAERYHLLCQKLVLEQIYSAATLILSPRSASKTGAYQELSPSTGLRAFVSKLAGHIAAESARTV